MEVGWADVNPLAESESFYWLGDITKQLHPKFLVMEDDSL